jgi:hypothetical protein
VINLLRAMPPKRVADIFMRANAALIGGVRTGVANAAAGLEAIVAALAP